MIITQHAHIYSFHTSKFNFGEKNSNIFYQYSPYPSNWMLLPILLELYTKSVFSSRYRLVFLGIYHTNTDGKLGRYKSVSKRGRLPPFFLKSPFWGKKGGTIQKRGERYLPKYRKPSKSDTSKIPIPKKLLVTPWYTTLDFIVIKSRWMRILCLSRTQCRSVVGLLRFARLNDGRNTLSSIFGGYLSIKSLKRCPQKIMRIQKFPQV